MDTLRNIRIKLGASQAEFAEKIQTNVPNYSNIETGIVQPSLEACIILEKHVNERIIWHSSFSKDEKDQIIQSIDTLLNHYPLFSVLHFTQKSLREGIRLGKPDILLSFYAETARKINDENH